MDMSDVFQKGKLCRLGIGIMSVSRIFIDIIPIRGICIPITTVKLSVCQMPVVHLLEISVKMLVNVEN